MRKIRAICEGYVDKYCQEDSPIINVKVRHKWYKEAFVEETAEMSIAMLKMLMRFLLLPS